MRRIKGREAAEQHKPKRALTLMQGGRAVESRTHAGAQVAVELALSKGGGE